MIICSIFKNQLKEITFETKKQVFLLKNILSPYCLVDRLISKKLNIFTSIK